MKTLYEIVPENLDAASARLLVVVGEHTASFVIGDQEEQKIRGIAVYENEEIDVFVDGVDKLFNDVPFLSEKFREIHIVYNTNENVLVPDVIYNSDRVEEVLNLVFGYNALPEYCFSDGLKCNQHQNCYRIEKKMVELLGEKFDMETGANSEHADSIRINRRIEGGDCLYLSIEQHQIHISLFKDHQCLLINRYPFKTKEDISYYVLAALQQNGIEQLPVVVSGFVEKDSNIYEELNKYFQDISFSVPDDEKMDNEALQAFPKHYFTQLVELF